MKVFVLTYGWREDIVILGVFTSAALACSFRDRNVASTNRDTLYYSIVPFELIEKEEPQS